MDLSTTKKQTIQLKNGQKTLIDSFSKENIQMASTHIKERSVSLIIKEMQIKTARRYELTLVRMVIIKNSANNKCCRGCGEKGALLYCLWEYINKFIQSLWRRVWRILKNTNKKATIYVPEISLLGMYPEKK